MLNLKNSPVTLIKAWFLAVLTALSLISCSVVQVSSPEEALAKAEAQLIAVYNTIHDMKISGSITPSERGSLIREADKIRSVLDEAYVLLSRGESMDTKIDLATALLTALIIHLEEHNG